MEVCFKQQRETKACGLRQDTRLLCRRAQCPPEPCWNYRVHVSTANRPDRHIPPGHFVFPRCLPEQLYLLPQLNRRTCAVQYRTRRIANWSGSTTQKRRPLMFKGASINNVVMDVKVMIYCTPMSDRGKGLASSVSSAGSALNVQYSCCWGSLTHLHFGSDSGSNVKIWIEHVVNDGRGAGITWTERRPSPRARLFRCVSACLPHLRRVIGL